MQRKFLKYFLYVFCTLFFIDGFLSTIHTLFGVANLAQEWMLSVRNTVAYVTLFLCLPFVFFYGFSNLPKKNPLILIPLYFISLDFIQIPMVKIQAKYLNIQHLFFNKPYNYGELIANHFDMFLSDFFTSFIQLILGIIVLVWLKRNKDYFNIDISIHWFKKSSFALGLPVVLLSSYILGMAFTTLNIIEYGSRNYIKVSATGLVLTEKTFTKGNTKVRLIPMIHIGKKEFYKEINKDIDATTTLYLLEGVKDKENLICDFNYRDIASKTGQERQADHFKPGEHVQKEFQTSMIRTLSADIDASEMDPKTIEILKMTQKMHKSDGASKFLALHEQLKSKDTSTLFYDLIQKRNDKLMELFAENEKKYNTIIIPWGALHLPDIQERLIELGYIDSGKYKERVAIDFLKRKK